jgi:large subunit ribosomal protein L9
LVPLSLPGPRPAGSEQPARSGRENPSWAATGTFELLEVGMKVILIENVPSLGKAGDLVPVAEGYGRNFLIPKKLALEATPANLRHLERQKESFLQKATKEKQKATELAARIQQLSCTLARPAGESEKIFGSVTTLDLNKFLQEQGISLDRRKIHLPHPIKTLGSYTVALKLHPDVTAQMKVDVVAASPEEKDKG